MLVLYNVRPHRSHVMRNVDFGSPPFDVRREWVLVARW